MKEASGRIERLAGVNVIDAEGYREYRKRMIPLLEAHGGKFVLDVEVSRVLCSASNVPLNRLFAIGFPSKERLDAFYSSPEYREVRRELFEPSVSHSTQIGMYEVLL